MIGVVIVAHGGLAPEYLSAVEHVVGRLNGVRAIEIGADIMLKATKVDGVYSADPVTHPEANLLTFWSIRDRQIIKAIGIENPRGITQTLDEKNFVISYGEKPAIAYISSNDLTPLAETILQPTFASGDHLLNWSQSLREVMPTRIYG